MSLNAPFGARCFLTSMASSAELPLKWGLNAPFGARCFLTQIKECTRQTARGLNVPFGARCFLAGTVGNEIWSGRVLMHRLVLGAF